MDNNYDWSKFTVKQPTNASVKEIEKLLSTQAGFETWFLREAIFMSSSGIKRKEQEVIQPTDTYRWMWYGYPDSVFETGEILSAEADEFIRFRFGTAGIVSIKILSENNLTIIELIQTQIPTNEEAKVSWHLGCKTGWTFYLLNLKSILEGGLDLRNRNNELRLD